LLTTLPVLGYSSVTPGPLMARILRWVDIRLLYKRELRSALRERNIVVNGILIPIFLYPLMLWLIYTGITFVGGQTEGYVSRIVLKALPQEHQALKLEFSRDPRIELKEASDPLSDIRNGAVDLLAEFLPPEPAAASLQGNFRVQLTCDNSKDRSAIARDRFKDVLARYRDRYFERQAGTLGISPAQLQRFWVETRNVATSRQMGGFILGLMLPLFLIIMVAMGTIFPAIDCTAGEREKSTWETSMTIATARANIVAAKYLYVATMASLAGILNLAAMLLSMKSVMAPLMGGRTDSLSFQIPLMSIPIIIVVTVLLAMFVGAGMMILAAFARTFKEGQSMVSPFYIAVFLPILFLQVPGIEFTVGLALIPVVNVAMVAREAVAGTFHWHLIGITLAVEVLCILLGLWLATIILRYEDFLMGSYGGSFGKFLKERLLGGRRRGRQ
jgi:sodium transport system permease protein